MSKGHPPSDLVVHHLGLESGPTLILLHGLGDSGACWPDAVRRWMPHYRVLTVDARGHGQSPRWSADQLRAGQRAWQEIEATPWAETKARTDVNLLATGIAALATPRLDLWRRIAVPSLLVTGTDEVIFSQPESITISRFAVKARRVCREAPSRRTTAARRPHRRRHRRCGRRQSSSAQWIPRW